jgi:hypothetical protein
MVSLFPGLQQSDSERAARTRALKNLVRDRFNLSEDDGVFVAEIACGETDCPDVETVIATFLDGERREFKIGKLTGGDVITCYFSYKTAFFTGLMSQHGTSYYIPNGINVFNISL